MNVKRADRLKGLFLREIVAALGELKDPGLSGFITVTDVEIAEDLKTAKVFYSMLGSEIDKEMTLRALERSAGYLHKWLFDRLRIRRVPKIAFAYDDTPEKAQRVETILAKLQQEEGAPPPEAATRLDSVASKAFPRRRPRRR